MQFDSGEPDKVMVHCTDNDRKWEGTVIQSHNDVVKVMLEGVPLNFNRYKGKNLYVANFSGMELTFSFE
jgi:hypothetical protein|tara:strand:+ start:538 stop:744 length:207 start_codon:yes stop_codon:yes gene_type:complete